MTEAKERCKEDVYSGRFTFIRCERNAVRDGFCKQHHPEFVAAKTAKREAAWKERTNAINAKYAQQAKERAVLAAAKAWGETPANSEESKRALGVLMIAAFTAWPKVSP